MFCPRRKGKAPRPGARQPNFYKLSTLWRTLTEHLTSGIMNMFICSPDTRQKGWGFVDKVTALCQNRRVLFAATKQKSYLRNTQEMHLLAGIATQLTCAVSDSCRYPVRLVQVWAALIRHLFGRRYDTAFFGFAPQLMLPFLWLYRLRGTAVSIDFFISVYDTLVDDRKKFSPGGLPARLCHWLDHATLAAADLVIVDTQADRDFFCREFECPAEKVQVLYLEADSAFYKPRPPRAPDGRFVVLYFGSALPLQGVEVILDAARRLEEDPAVKFVLIGPFEKAFGVQPTCYPNVQFIPWLSQPQLADAIAGADLCLAGHFSGTIGKAARTIAGKTYIYRAMEKPVVLGDGPANRELFHPGNGVYFVPLGDGEALARCIAQRRKEWSADGPEQQP